MNAQADSKVTLGIRPEDCRIVEGGHLRGEVFGVEPTGEATHLTVTAANQLVEVKAPRDFRAALDSPIGIEFDPAHLFFFDSASGQRLAAAAQ